MLCACEASVVATINAERMRKEREENIQKFKQQTIDFCENVIGEQIADVCLRGGNCARIIFSAIEMNHSIEMKTCRMGIVQEKTTYANGKHSYTADKSNPEINLDLVIEYLQAHCYKTSTYPEWYKEWGYGDRKGTELWIEW